MNLAKLEAQYLRHYRKVIPTILVVTALLWVLIGQKFATWTFAGLISADIAMFILIAVRAVRNKDQK